MAQPSRKWILFLGIGAGIVLFVVVGMGYLLQRLQSLVEEPDAGVSVREYRPQQTVQKIYGPVSPPLPRREVPDTQSTEETPEPYVPPRYQIVFRQAPPQVPPGAPRFPPLTDSQFYTISRKEFSEWAHLPIAEMGGRFVPNFRWGHLEGIKVSELEQQTFYRRLGLYREDVITRINGKPIVAPGQMRTLFQTIAKRYRNLTVEFQRGGKSRTVDFSLR